MAITIEAVYANGAFQPKQPVELAEGTPVHLTVQPAGEAEDPLEEVIGICDNGPELSLAARHDEFAYGIPMDQEPAP